MLDYKTQSQIADATAAIMVACFRVATSTAAASADRGWSLWSDMIEAGRQAELGLPQAWWPRASLWPVLADRDLGPVAPADPAYAAYRSAGGHAAAQVIVPAAEELAQAGTAMVLAPVHTLLSAWRLALRH